MFAKSIFTLGLSVVCCLAPPTAAWAQLTPLTSSNTSGSTQWRASPGNAKQAVNLEASRETPAATPTASAPASAGAAIGSGATVASPGVVAQAIADAKAREATQRTRRGPLAKVTNGSGALPNDGGQVWREYDITPYTLRVTSTNRPEQALVDWILRETGYEAWHSEPLGLLSADKRTLRVYHTPQMQKVVGEMVDRFVNGEAESHAFGMRIASMTNPNWRAKAHKMLHPVPVQTPGVEAWLLAKEDAAQLVAELSKRSDYREHSSPHLLVNNGQSTIVTPPTRPRNYVRNVALKPAWPGFDPEMAQVDEGFSVDFNPLLSLDGKTIDAVIKCNIDQVEKMWPVMIDVPTTAAPRQRTQIEVPQLSSIRVQERFHWPVDQVLLVSLGVVPTPAPTDPALKLPLTTGPARADLLLFVESKGVATKPALPVANAPAAQKPQTQLYHGRY